MNDPEQTQPLPAQETSEHINEEIAKNEQYLNEEQLQDITGGCEICGNTLKAADDLQKSAHADLERATRNPTRADTNLLLNRAARKLSTVDLYHRAIIASGHVDVSQLPQRPRMR